VLGERSQGRRIVLLEEEGARVRREQGEQQRPGERRE
jgi:hypothetical protein